MAILGALCGGLLFLKAPQCLANPLDSLPPDVKSLWLNNVTEAQSIMHPSLDKKTSFPFMVGAPVVAIIILGLGLWKTFSIGGHRVYVKCFVLALLISALGLTFYQVRFSPFAYVVAIVPLAAWVAKVYKETKLKNPTSIIYLGALLVSVPLAWVVPGAFIETAPAAGQETLNKKQTQCASEEVLNSLNTLPTGTIMANPNMTCLLYTSDAADE